MPRPLKTQVLDGFARRLAAAWLTPNRKPRRPLTTLKDGTRVVVEGERWSSGPNFVIQELFTLAYKDEFDHVYGVLRDHMGARSVVELDQAVKGVLTPRDDKVLEAELRKRLAITPDGDHVEGAIGRVQVGRRLMGHRERERETSWSIARRKALGLPKSERVTERVMCPVYWPIYAGEAEERMRPGGGVADEFPADYYGVGVGAEVTRIANVAAIAACNAIVDLLDAGADDGVLIIYGDTIPTDVDTGIGAQTQLALHALASTAFGAAADGDPGGTATAAAIADDTDIDDTATATFFRASETDNGTTPTDDLIDGNAGTADEALVLNTASYVTGATSQISSWTFTVPES